MKRLLPVIGLVGAGLLASGCLTTTEKDIMDPPWRAAQNPATQVAVASSEGEVASVYFSKDEVPVIDGRFDEWTGLAGVHTRAMVYGGLFDPQNTDGLFIARTDGTNFYLYADVSDDSANENQLPAPQAWRGDSVEFFFGTEIMSHSDYRSSDIRVRLVPRSKVDSTAFDICVNDAQMSNPDIKVATVFGANGYRIEASIPLSLLNVKTLKEGQKLRMEFQVNDADNGKERSRLLHWMSGKDAAYMDPSTWGDGKVVPLARTTEAGGK